MQVYRYMDIATAKPDKAQLSDLPHHLIDVVDPDQEFQAAMFADMAREKIREVRSRGRTPVVVGGTGLYIKALVYGLAPAPARSERIRKALRSVMVRKGVEGLETMLARLDPEAALRIKKNDAVRVIRALEIIFQTGCRASGIMAEHAFHEARYEARIACIMPERVLLFRDIDARTMAMFESGLLDETRRLLAMGYGQELRSMQTLAYKHVVRHLRGEIGQETAAGLIQRDTRRYAKRQITWMKARPDHRFFGSPGLAYEQVSAWLDEEEKP
jgi:tRNA dimethylallyltransferase